MSDDDPKQLHLAMKSEFDRDNRDDVTDRVIEEVKPSTVFQYNWEDHPCG